MNKLTFIDLFAGIGGMRLAFEAIGAECILTCEIDENALLTYKKNYTPSGLHKYVGDIRKLKNKEVPSHDILVAGFPCQPYSIAGLRKGLADERGKVFSDILRIIKAKKPKVFLLENVKGITTHDNGETFKYIIKRLEKLGYFIKAKNLNSMTHCNIPQNRERVFIVGFIESEACEKFVFPPEVNLSVKFRSLLEKRKVNDKYFYDNRYDVYEKIKKSVKNKNRVYQWRRHYVRENKSGVCPTLTANMGSGGHNVPLILDKSGKIRKLTPRECARFQGFPDNFIFPDIGDAKLYHQFGNSVTVPLIVNIAIQIKKALT